MKFLSIFCLTALILSQTVNSARAAENAVPVLKPIDYSGKYLSAHGQIAKYGSASKSYIVVEGSGPGGTTGSFDGRWTSSGGNAQGNSSLAINGANGGTLSGSGSTTYNSASGSGTHQGVISGSTSDGQTFGWTNTTSFSGNSFTSNVTTQNKGSYTVNGSKGSGITVTPL